MSIEEQDKLVTRCPRIGDFVPFKYCRTSGSPFCWVIINCWAVRIDIGQFLADNYAPEVIQQGLTRPEAGMKIGKMVEMAQRWKKDES